MILIGGFDPNKSGAPTEGFGWSSDSMPNNNISKGNFWLITRGMIDSLWGDLEIGDNIVAIKDEASEFSDFIIVKSPQYLDI